MDYKVNLVRPVGDIRRQAHRLLAPHWREPHPLESIWSDPERLVVWAEQERRCIGVLVARATTTVTWGTEHLDIPWEVLTECPHELGLIESVVVDTAWRQTGIGSHLLAEGLTLLREEGLACILAPVPRPSGSTALDTQEKLCVGWTPWQTVPEYWRSVSELTPAECPLCGPDAVCTCEAVLYRPENPGLRSVLA